MGSPWRDKISLAILELQEKGEIQMLYDKWWKSPKDQCVADKTRQSNKANALGVNNIGGVFVLLLCGLAFAVLIAILEFYHSTRQQQKQFPYLENIECKRNNSKIENSNYLDIDNSVMNQLNDIKLDDISAKRQSLFTNMTNELCLAIKCQGSRQRAVFNNQCTNCQFIRNKYRYERNQIDEQINETNLMETSLSAIPSMPTPSSSTSTNVYNIQ